MNFLYLWVVKRTVYILLAAFVVLASIPWLVPHLGAFALFAFVPLLCADRIAEDAGIRHFLALVYLAFVLWNAATTWWVCEATVGGGIFAVLANAAQMWLVWAAFRLNKKRLKGCLSYILLASAWVAWEKWYLVSAQISWPWLALGNAFASTTSLVQWYSATGLLGGSLWVWACNLSLFGLMVALSDGRFFSWNSKARVCSLAGTALVLLAPIIISEHIYRTYEQKDECGTLDVAIAQSDFDPYEKFVKYTQSEQNDCALRLFSNIGEGPLLLMTPETFTSDVVLNNIAASPTVSSFMPLLESHPRANLLLGSATVGYSYKKSAPSKVARSVGNAWVQSHNSALMLDHSGRADVYHKSKLVVGTELLPYPDVFVPIDNMLGGVIARCEGQDRVECLPVHIYSESGCLEKEVPAGVAICYESVYPEHCAEYVRDGAQFLSVITNDGWWGNTPGYRQHFSYSRLRAIETRRDIARCANTGISAIIDQRGDVVSQTEWWTEDLLEGSVDLTEYQTPFVKYGDVAGRVSCLLLIAVLLVLPASFIKKF